MARHSSANVASTLGRCCQYLLTEHKCCSPWRRNPQLHISTCHIQTCSKLDRIAPLCQPHIPQNLSTGSRFCRSHKMLLPLVGNGLRSEACLYGHTEARKVEMVTFENIFDDANRDKVKRHLDEVKSVRTVEMMGMKGTELNKAAVLVPLCVVDGEPSVLFTLRSSSLRKHRGEVSFPGGRQDESDPDYTHTALRETFEEIGLTPRYFDIWGTLTPTPSSKSTKTLVYPVVARYTKDLDVSKLKLNTEEVEEVFTCSIRDLCDQSKIRTGSTQFRTGFGYTIPVYIGGPHRIWGLTAVFLHQVLTLLAPRLYTYKVKHVA